MAHPPSFAEEGGVELVVLELSFGLLLLPGSELAEELVEELLDGPSAVALDGFLPPSRKSVTYQPFPFRIKPVRLSSFTSGPL